MATVAERIELLHNNLAHVEAMGGEKKVEKNNFIRGFTAVCGLGGGIYFFCSSYVRRGTV